MFFWKKDCLHTPHPIYFFLKHVKLQQNSKSQNYTEVTLIPHFFFCPLHLTLHTVKTNNSIILFPFCV